MPAAAACPGEAGKVAPVVDRNRCEAKADCVRVCPYDVFEIRTLSREERAGLGWLGRLRALAHGHRQAFVVRPGACHACRLCVEACPEDALSLAPHREPAPVAATHWGPGEIDAFVRDHANERGHETFPDNPDVEWIVIGVRHLPDLVLALVEPRPATVGYARFQFAFVGGGPAPPRYVATYCLDEGRFVLLCTAARAPSTLPQQLD